VLEAAIRLASRRRAELAAELARGWRPLSREEAERLLDELAVDLGVEDAAGDVDRVLYGAPQGEAGDERSG